MKRRYLEMVLLRWIDSEAEVGWGEISQGPLHKNYSIGFIIDQTLEVYVLAADYDPENDHFNRVMRIPRECVKEVRVITVIPIRQSPEPS